MINVGKYTIHGCYGLHDLFEGKKQVFLSAVDEIWFVSLQVLRKLRRWCQQPSGMFMWQQWIKHMGCLGYILVYAVPMIDIWDYQTETKSRYNYCIHKMRMKDSSVTSFLFRCSCEKGTVIVGDTKRPTRYDRFKMREIWNQKLYTIPSLKLTLPLKFDGWKMHFPFEMAYFQDYILYKVLGRVVVFKANSSFEGIESIPQMVILWFNRCMLLRGSGYLVTGLGDI